MKLEIRPKCFPFDKHGNDVQDQMKNCVAFTAGGYYLPCCWMDTWRERQENKHGLFNEELNVNSGKTAKEIINSETWKKFYKMIFQDPDNVCQKCKDACGVLIHEDGSETNYWEQ